MNRNDFLQKYWRFYLLLEDKFKQTLNYVEVTEDNFASYSIEYAYILQSVGSELDSFFKQYCDFPLDAHKTMKDYQKVLLQSNSELTSQEVRYIHSSNILLQPFASWSATDQVPYRDTWWKAFNLVKHGRPGHLKQASQGHVLYALSGLYLLEMSFLKIITLTNVEPNRPEQESEFFSLENWEYNSVRNEDAFLCFMELFNEQNILAKIKKEILHKNV